MSKMTQCKVCGAQIAKSASVCPHCGAKRKKHGFLKLLLLIAVIVVVVSAYQQNMLPIGPKTTGSPAVSTQRPQNETSSSTKSSTSSAASTKTPSSDSQQPASQNAANTSSTDNSSNVREFLDSYETFMNEYCDFLETYDSNNSSSALKYLSLMSQYADFAKKADSFSEEDMTQEDRQYFIEVMNRTNARLLQTSSNLS